MLNFLRVFSSFCSRTGWIGWLAPIHMKRDCRWWLFSPRFIELCGRKVALYFIDRFTRGNDCDDNEKKRRQGEPWTKRHSFQPIKLVFHSTFGNGSAIKYPQCVCTRRCGRERKKDGRRRKVTKKEKMNSGQVADIHSNYYMPFTCAKSRRNKKKQLYYMNIFFFYRERERNFFFLVLGKK